MPLSQAELRARVLAEIVSTEQDYVAGLRLLVEVGWTSASCCCCCLALLSPTIRVVSAGLTSRLYIRTSTT